MAALMARLLMVTSRQRESEVKTALGEAKETLDVLLPTGSCLTLM